MIEQIIDAIINNYEHRLTATREDLMRTSDMLTAMTEKYEQVAEGIRLARAKETARQETAALDELGLRKAARG